MSRKSKFRVGQVVFVDEEGLYGAITGIYGFYDADEDSKFQRYGVSYAHEERKWDEDKLRPLTRRERGR